MSIFIRSEAKKYLFINNYLLQLGILQKAILSQNLKIQEIMFVIDFF